jgi:hypothetical protein
MIGRGSIDAMKFRETTNVDVPFAKFNKFEKALLAKSVNDTSDLLRIAEICRYKLETKDTNLEDMLAWGPPDACVPRLILAVFEYATKERERLLAQKL